MDMSLGVVYILDLFAADFRLRSRLSESRRDLSRVESYEFLRGTDKESRDIYDL